MSQIIVDVTQLVNWTGRLTGVPRVMDELSTRFAKDRDDCLFVEWDGLRKVFCEVNLEEALASRIVTVKDEPIQEIQVGGIKQIVKDMESRFWVVRQALRVPRKAIRVARDRRPKITVGEEPSRKVITPRKGDLLFILCDWHERPLVDEAVALHKKGVRLATVAYDMLPIVTPQYSGHATERLTYFGANIYPRCEIIFSISEHTKKDITEWLQNQKLKVPSIAVFRLGDDFQMAKPSRPQETAFAESRLKGNDFLLCVGTIEARKNHTLLYYAYKLAYERGIELPKIVIVGRRGWKTDDAYELITSDPQTKDKFVMLHDVSDEEQSWLYARCMFSVYPSFYEGWGLPIAESISRGVPCVCSNTSSMPEVGGDLVGYFSPVSTDECLAAITKLLRPKELESARKRIKKYKPTTWDETFESMNKIVGEVYGSQN